MSEELKDVSVRASTAEAVLPLRVRHRQEMNCQIVHDSIHQRDGWTATYILDVLNVTAGFGSIAIASGGHSEFAPANLQATPDMVDRFRWIFLAGGLGFLLAFLALLRMEERPLSVRQQTRPFK